MSRLQTILRHIGQIDSDRGGAPYRALFLLPVLTVLILAVLWVTIIDRLRVEKDAADGLPSSSWISTDSRNSTTGSVIIWTMEFLSKSRGV